jgi:hypothetical protein
MIQLMIFFDVMPKSYQWTPTVWRNTCRDDKDAVRLYVQDVGKVTKSSMQGEQETELMSQKNCESQYNKLLLAGQCRVQTLVRARSLCQNKAVRVWH